jgi:hypothetical protein
VAVNTKSRGAIRLVLTDLLEGNKARIFTATGGTTTTTVESGIANGVYVDDHFNNYELTNQTRGWTTQVTDFTKSTGTYTHPVVSSASQNGDQCEAHSPAAFNVRQYNTAMDLAVQGAAHAKALGPKVSEALVVQAGRSLYPMPSGFKYLSRVSIDNRDSYYARHQSGAVDALTGIKDAAGRTYLAQSFEIVGSNPVYQLGDLAVLLARVGSPTGTLTFTVHADSSGSPSATVLATYTVSDVSALDTEATYQALSPDKRPLLATSTTYWIKVTGSYSVSSSAYVAWGEDTDGGYGDGTGASSSDGTTFTNRTGDFIFTLRGAQPSYERLESPHSGPDAHWRIVQSTTRYLEFTPAGMEYLRDLSADGFVLRLEGQGYPTLPASDSATIDLPYDYIVMRSGLLLAQMNPSWLAANNPAASSLFPLWERRVAEVEAGMLTWPDDGAVEVEPL